VVRNPYRDQRTWAPNLEKNRRRKLFEPDPSPLRAAETPPKPSWGSQKWGPFSARRRLSRGVRPPPGPRAGRPARRARRLSKRQRDRNSTVRFLTLPPAGQRKIRSPIKEVRPPSPALLGPEKRPKVTWSRGRLPQEPVQGRAVLGQVKKRPRQKDQGPGPRTRPWPPKGRASK